MKHLKNGLRIIVSVFFLLVFGMMSDASQRPPFFVRVDGYIKEKFSNWELVEIDSLDNSEGKYGDKKFQFSTSYSFEKSGSKIEISLCKYVNKEVAREALIITANSHSSGQRPIERADLGDFALVRGYQKIMLYHVQKNDCFIDVRFSNCSLPVSRRESYIRELLGLIN